jgi:hypothetical protein
MLQGLKLLLRSQFAIKFASIFQDFLVIVKFIVVPNSTAIISCYSFLFKLVNHYLFLQFKSQMLV